MSDATATPRRRSPGRTSPDLPGGAMVSGEENVRYAERLYLPWWLWIAALAVTALLAAEIHLGAPGLRSWVPYALLLPLAAVGLWWSGRVRVAVVGSELHVDDARLPVGCIVSVEPVSPERRRDLLGRDAHPLAFVVQRPWIRGMARVTLDDPDDPTPYWLLSCRRPAALADAIRKAQQQEPDAGG